MRAMRTIGKALLTWGIVASLSLDGGGALARSSRKPKASAADVQQASKLLTDGKAALIAKTIEPAKTLFEDAYRKNPSAEVLFQLGKLAEAEGRMVAAQDVMRRYLHETAGDEEGPDQKEAQRIAQLVSAPAGEVHVLGARGAWVVVDDHLVGALPLPLPLLLESGNHRIIVELGDQRIEEQVKALPGQTVEMRFNQKTGTVVVSVPPALVLFLDGDFTAENQKSLTQAVGKVLAKDRQVVVPGEKALKLKPQLTDCLQTASCLAELANANEALYVLRVRAKRVPPAPVPASATPAGQPPTVDKASWQFDLEVFDPSVGDIAGKTSVRCDDCAVEQAFQSASATLGTVVQQSASRARGSVEISSKPSGADVFLGGEKVGVTPYKASRFVGSVPLELRLLGQPPFSSTLTIEAGQVAQVEAVLSKPGDDAPEPDPKLPPPVVKAPVYRTEVMPRPKWRLALGGSLIGLGVLSLGFGISALQANGKSVLNPICPDGKTVCQQIYDTGKVGGGLTVFGLAAIAGGMVTVVLPGSKQQVQVSTALSPSMMGLAAFGTY